MKLSSGESRGTFKARLLREGRWESFCQQREALKVGGMEPRKAWQQAAQAFFEPLNVVDHILVIGCRHTPATQWLADTCPPNGIPVHLVASWDGFDPQTVAGRRFVGIVLGDGGTVDAAEEFVRKISPAVKCGWLRGYEPPGTA